MYMPPGKAGDESEQHGLKEPSSQVSNYVLCDPGEQLTKRLLMETVIR